MRLERWLGRRAAPGLVLAVLLTACSAGSQPAAPAASAPTGLPTGGSPVAAAPPASINYGYPSISSQWWHIFVGRDQGFYAAEGIELEPTFMSQGAPAIAQNVVAGTFQVGSVGVDTLLRAQEQGAQLALVGGELRQAPFGFIAIPEVRSFADLRGKTLGAASLRGGTSTLLRHILAGQGLQEERDYTLVAAGSTSERVSALRSRAIAAGLMAQPQDLQLQDDGFTLLGYAGDFVGAYALGSAVVRRDWAQSNADVLLRFLRANGRAINWLYDPANRQEAVDTLARQTRSDEPTTQRTYDVMIERLRSFTPNGEPDEAAVGGSLRVMVEGGELAGPGPAPGTLIDRSYWERAFPAGERR